MHLPNNFLLSFYLLNANFGTLFMIASKIPISDLEVRVALADQDKKT